MENKIDDTNKHDTTSDNDKNDIDTLNTPDWLSREWARKKMIHPLLHRQKKYIKRRKTINRLIALIIILLLVLVGFVFANSDSSSDNPTNYNYSKQTFLIS